MRTLATLFALLAVAFPSPTAASRPPIDRAVQAAFLPKFARYVQWPTSVLPAPDAPLRLCIVGDDPFGSLIEEAARGTVVDQHPVVLRRVKASDAVGDCQIAFVAGSRATVRRTLRKLEDDPVLTVTAYETDRTRGIVNFVLHDGRVRFLIDERAASEKGLVISARLLNLALRVRRSAE
jgi:hypothetical protein